MCDPMPCLPVDCGTDQRLSHQVHQTGPCLGPVDMYSHCRRLGSRAHSERRALCRRSARLTCNMSVRMHGLLCISPCSIVHRLQKQCRCAYQHQTSYWARGCTKLLTAQYADAAQGKMSTITHTMPKSAPLTPAPPAHASSAQHARRHTS